MIHGTIHGKTIDRDERSSVTGCEEVGVTLRTISDQTVRRTVGGSTALKEPGRRHRVGRDHGQVYRVLKHGRSPQIHSLE